MEAQKPETRLKAALAGHDLPAVTVAEEAGVSRSAVSRAVNGDRCGVDAAFRIAGYLSAKGIPLSAQQILEDVRDGAAAPSSQPVGSAA